MKKLVASLIVSVSVLAGVSAPAVAQERHTDMINDKGQSVDSLLLQWAFDATWVIDKQRILLRDEHRDYYLVTLSENCEKLVMDRPVNFSPALTGRIRASLQYQVRDIAGPYCYINRVAEISDNTASDLRAELATKKNG